MVMKLRHFESRSEIPGKFLNVVLEEDEDDQIDRSCEKWSITKSEEGEEYTKIKRRKTNWTGHILRWNCLILHVMEINIEGRVEVTGRRGRRYKMLKKREDTGIEREGTRSHSVEKLLWKRLWTCRKKDYRMNEDVEFPRLIDDSLIQKT